MKKILFAILMFLFLLMWSGTGLAVGTLTLISTQELMIVNGIPQRIILTYQFTADKTTATIPVLAIDASIYKIFGYYLYSVETNTQASPTPTNLWDIIINNQDGLDVCYSQALDRDITKPSDIVFCATTGKSYYSVKGNLVLGISGNSVNGATGIVILTFLAN